MARVALAFATIVLATTGWGCGASLRMVHQSNAYFERCHGADYDPSITRSERRGCWAAWLDHYTGGQPPDRVEFARARVRELDAGDNVTPLPGLGAPVVESTSYTAVFYDTPVEGTDDPADIVPPRERIRRPPNAHGACATVCAPRWDRCVVACGDRGSTCEEACESEHRTCMAGCY